MSVAWVGAGIAAVGAYSQYNSQKKQAEMQADAISEGGAIDSAARNKAVSQVLEIFGPSLVDFNKSIQGSIDLMEQGRISTGDLLAQSAQNVSQITQQGGQSALNAMLGLPSPETVSTAQGGPVSSIAAPQNQTPQGQSPYNENMSGIVESMGGYVPIAKSSEYDEEGLPSRLPPKTIPQGKQARIPTPGRETVNDPRQYLGGVESLPTNTAQQNMTAWDPTTLDTGFIQPTRTANNEIGVEGYPEGSGPIGPFPVGSQGYLDQLAEQAAANSAYQAAPTLEGELLPRDYNFNQQGVVMPSGTNAGLVGAEDAVRSGADLGRFDLAQGATGALESLNQQAGVARGDIGQGRDFALNQIQQAIQAGRTGINQGIDSINQGATQGVDAINQGANRSIGSINQGAMQGVNAINQGAAQGVNVINRGTQQGVSAIGAGADRGVSEIGRGVNQATSYLNPYMMAGQEALNPLLDLSGVRGQEAFDTARMNDPAYNLALQESERSLGRNAAVTGGIGSGNTKARFQLNAQQQAAADIDRQLGRIRAITDSGQDAANTAGGFQTQGGIASGNIRNQAGISQGNLINQGGIASSNILNQAGQSSGSILNQAGVNRSNVINQAGTNTGNILNQAGINTGQLQVRGGENEANQLNRAGDIGIQSSQQLSQIAQQLGMSESEVLQQLGGNLVNIDVGTGNQIGGMRESAGINAANIIQNTTNQQAGIDAGLAQQLAGLDQETLINIANSIQSGAGSNLSSQQQLATLLANANIGAGTSGQQTAINLGRAQASGVTNPIGNAINTGIGLYASGAFNQPNQSYTPYNGGYGNNGADYSNVTNENWGGI